MTTPAEPWAGTDAIAPSDLPTISKLFDDTLADVKDHFGGYAMAGVGFAAVQLPLTLVSIIGAYALIFASVIPGMQANDDEMVTMGLLGGTGVAILGLTLLFGLVFPPLQASLLRAVWAHQSRGEPLTLSAAFSTATHDLPRVYATVFLLGTASIIGMVLCYIPALIAAFLFHFAWVLAIVGRRSPFEAMRMSFEHVFSNLGWNLKIWGVVLLATLLLSNVPLIGTAAAILCGAAFTLRAAKAAFPDLGSES